jgi:nucleoside-diphosphate-sugar epimerase
MRVLIIGGSGHVGTLVIPFLLEHHTLRVLDKRPPQHEGVDFSVGDVTNYDDLVAALADMDAVIYLAMGSLDWDQTPGVVSAFDVNVKGVYLALKAAHDREITQAVYASTMSIYGGELRTRYFADEDIAPDATQLYGFTKRLGEEVCRNAAREWGMHVNALRLCHPTAEEKWLAETKADAPTIATTAGDVARAMLAALVFDAGFQAFTISGDYEQKIMHMAKAKRLLGWEPLARPVQQ